MIFSSPPQFGQCSRSRSNTRVSSFIQLIPTGRCCAQFGSHAESGVSWATGSGSCGTSCGTTRARSLPLCASTPRVRIRCSLGLCAKTASLCMNFNGDRTKRVLPSRQKVFSLRTTWLVALVCTRSLANAGGEQAVTVDGIQRPVRRVLRLIKRTIDKRGQMLIVP